jgi:hypothetical protein
MTAFTGPFELTIPFARPRPLNDAGKPFIHCLDDERNRRAKADAKKQAMPSCELF